MYPGDGWDGDNASHWSASKPHILPWLVSHTASSTGIFREVSCFRCTILGAGRQQRPLLYYRIYRAGISFLATQQLSRRARRRVSLGPLPRRGGTKALDGVRITIVDLTREYTSVKKISNSSGAAQLHTCTNSVCVVAALLVTWSKSKMTVLFEKSNTLAAPAAIHIYFRAHGPMVASYQAQYFDIFGGLVGKYHFLVEAWLSRTVVACAKHAQYRFRRIALSSGLQCQYEALPNEK